MAKLHKSVVLDAATARLDLAVQALTGASRAVVRGMFEHGCVTLNGALCAEPGQRGARGDVVLVDYDPEQKYRGTPPPPRLKFRVAFEDAHVIVVEKPAGVLSVPAERGRERTLLDEIEHYLRTEQPYDCAGSAKCETLGITLLDAIESDDPTALVGLPLIRTARLLREAGIDPLRP